jgi:hypothetical protein
MPRIAGTAEYYEAIEREMSKEDISAYDAEIGILYRCIHSMRFNEAKTHKEIQQYLEKAWGLRRGAYHRRLQWIRKQYVLP